MKGTIFLLHTALCLKDVGFWLFVAFRRNTNISDLNLDAY